MLWGANERQRMQAMGLPDAANAVAQASQMMHQATPEAVARAFGARLYSEYGGEEASRLADLVVRAVQMARRGCE